MKKQNNIKLFNNIKNFIKEIEESALKLAQQKKTLESQRDNIISEILSESSSELENAVCSWVNNNPKETLSLIWALYNYCEIFYKNSEDYCEIFGDDYDLTEEVYELVNKKTLQSVKITAKDIYSHYSSLGGERIMPLKLDFLDGYELELIDESGDFIDECHWDMRYEIGDDARKIEHILHSNFEVIEITDKNNVIFSRENVCDIIESNHVDLGYSEDSVIILDGNIPVGFIDFGECEGEDKSFLRIHSIEIFDEFTNKGYGKKAIFKLQEIYQLPIEGYCMQDERAYGFWSSVGATFDDCKNCDYYNGCDMSNCDEPLDYCFTLEY